MVVFGGVFGAIALGKLHIVLGGVGADILGGHFWAIALGKLHITFSGVRLACLYRRLAMFSSCEPFLHKGSFLSKRYNDPIIARRRKKAAVRIFIVRNNYNSEAMDASMLLATYLNTQGIDFEIMNSQELAGADSNPKATALINDGVDMAIALGGDGTILRTARQIQYAGIPILGINYGTLGFLANPNTGGVIEMCAAALAGDVVCEERTNLEIIVVCEGERDPYAEDEPVAGDGSATSERSGSEPGEPHFMFALNEAAVTRGANGRIIHFGLNIAGSKLADMRGDGLVVASATGSTAYALSAGGPLVGPGFNGLVTVPIAPHSLHSRAVVTAPNDVVEMELQNSQDERDATLFLDGELAVLPAPIAKLYMRKGPQATTLMRYGAKNFYDHAAEVFF